MCPLRFLLALLSLAVIAYCVVSAMAETETAAGPSAWARLTRKDRSWPRFIVTLFTGELLWQWWRGEEAPGAVNGDGAHDPTAPPEPTLLVTPPAAQ